MKQWMQKLSCKLAVWMQGRYGNDDLSRLTSILSIFLFILSWIPKLSFLYIPAWILLIWTMFRCYSKNINARRNELNKFLNIKWGFKNRWNDRKTHKYFKCKECGTKMRVPKGKGKIQITCPRCGTKVIKKT